ncbi:twitching motility protein PilT [Sulfolobus acidocaldarius SUSAZ]|nr:twitching motility protein PilT [Sulfolobus acidocaldarius SUSAZ]
MKILVDTNVIIYDLVENSQFHKEAEKILDSAETWVIPTIVIHELVWFLRDNNLENPDYVYAYVKNPKAEIVCDDAEIIRKAIDITRKEKLSFSRYNDLVILSHSISRKLPLATFDKRLSNLTKRYNVDIVK